MSAAAVSDAEFRGLCTALGHPEVADDPRFTSAMTRMAHATEMVTLLRQLALETTVDDFLRRAEEHDVPASRIVTLAEIADDAQVCHNEVFVEREHPAAGRLREPRPAARMSATPQRVGRHAPCYGEHTDEIVVELGLDPAALRAAGAVH